MYLILIVEVFPPADVISAGFGVLLCVHPSEYLYASQIDIYDFQAAKDFRKSKDTLVNILLEINIFILLRRVSPYGHRLKT